MLLYNITEYSNADMILICSRDLNTGRELIHECEKLDDTLGWKQCQDSSKCI